MSTSTKPIQNITKDFQTHSKKAKESKLISTYLKATLTQHIRITSQEVSSIPS